MANTHPSEMADDADIVSHTMPFGGIKTTSRHAIITMRCVTTCHSIPTLNRNHFNGDEVDDVDDDDVLRSTGSASVCMSFMN